MSCFHVVYSYVFSKWRSFKPVDINQYDITIATNYDITMGDDVARNAYCEITMGNDVAKNIHCDVTMHNDVAINVFYCVFSVLCLSVLFYYR